MTSASGAIRESVCHGTLTIDGVSMNRGAWGVLNNFVLWQPAEHRGDDILIPYSEGVLPRRRRRTSTKRTLEILVVGDVDRFGTVNVDRTSGLVENIEWLEANLLRPLATTAGTRTLVLTLPDGRTRTGEAHVGPATFGSVISGAFTVTLELSLPDGELGPPV